ncbi:MAG: cadmium-translocating P-type ATPase [Acholeplasmatales bacterium]|nr:cadmium-translocating P-type ATPase [Acholeplasmatales bacterium]
MIKENKILIIRIIISTIVWIFTILLEHVILNDSFKSEMIYLSFYITAYLIIGIDVLYKAIKNILRGNFLDELFLMSLATIGAFLMRLFSHNEYKEAVAIMIFFQIGEVFEKMAVYKSRNKILETMKLQVFDVMLLDGTIINPCDVKIDDIIIIKPGEMVPVDGISLSNGAINCASLTGEALDVDVIEGDIILSGSINLSTPLKIKVSKEYNDSTQKKILDLVENSTMYKAKSEKFITKFAKYYTPIVVLIALLLALLPPTILGFIHGFDITDYRLFIKEALICLVISCPCALVVSVPLTFFSGIGAAAKKKIIIKGSSHLEDLCSVDTIILDKTGTLTKGEFEIRDIISSDKEELMKVAKGLESKSTHPLAKAINNYNCLGYEFDIEEQPGYGVVGKKDGSVYLLGSKKLLGRYNIDVSQSSDIGSELFIAKDNKLIGSIVLEDKLKDEAIEAINKLKELNIRIVVLSGDTFGSVKSICERLGIKEYYHSLLPKDKVEIASKIIKSEDTNKVMFVGDGINDAPVLALSDVGVSMGQAGSDSAIEASDIVVLNDNLNALPKMKRIARKTKVIVLENIFISLIIKVGIMVLSIISAFKILNFELPMYVAIFGDVGVLILAILNATRALKAK